MTTQYKPDFRVVVHNLDWPVGQDPDAFERWTECVADVVELVNGSVTFVAEDTARDNGYKVLPIGRQYLEYTNDAWAELYEPFDVTISQAMVSRMLDTLFEEAWYWAKYPGSRARPVGRHHALV